MSVDPKPGARLLEAAREMNATLAGSGGSALFVVEWLPSAMITMWARSKKDITFRLDEALLFQSAAEARAWIEKNIPPGFRNRYKARGIDLDGLVGLVDDMRAASDRPRRAP